MDLVSDGEEPSQSASVSRGVGSGTGSCGKTTPLALSLSDSSGRLVPAKLVCVITHAATRGDGESFLSVPLKQTLSSHLAARFLKVTETWMTR